MKLLPRNKNVGLFFFGALIITASWLFVSDRMGSKNTATEATYTRGSGEETNSQSVTNQFSQTDWQRTLNELGVNTLGAVSAFSPSDIMLNEGNTVSSDNTKLRTYANDIKHALRRYSDPSMPNEVSIMINAYENNDSSTLTNGIGVMQNLHTQTISDLQRVTVPGEMGVYHLTIMNSLRAIIATDEAMKGIFTDVNKATVAAEAYATNVELFHSTLEKISALMSRNGLVLTDAEKLQIYLGVMNNS